MNELEQSEKEDLTDFDALTEKYRPMLLRLARKVRGMFPSIEHDDLFQEGLLALHRSTELWDPTQGAYFAVYARKAVEFRMRSYARTYLPHVYVRDDEKSALTGKSEFKRRAIYTDGLDFNETNDKRDDY